MKQRRWMRRMARTAGIGVLLVAGWSAAWGDRERGFPDDELEPLLELVLGADRDHGGARHSLGYVRYDGNWVSREDGVTLREEDRALALRAQGYLRYRGEWMLAGEIDWHAYAKKWQRATP